MGKDSTFIDIGGSYEKRRELTAIDAHTAWGLGRPAMSHVVIDTMQDFLEFPEYGNSPDGIRRSRTISQRRETLDGEPL